MFLKPGFEGSTCLSHVCHLTVRAGQLVYTVFLIFALGNVFFLEAFFDCVVCCESNISFRVFLIDLTMNNDRVSLDTVRDLTFLMETPCDVSEKVNGLYCLM